MFSTTYGANIHMNQIYTPVLAPLCKFKRTLHQYVGYFRHDMYDMRYGSVNTPTLVIH